jgi:hypothetical protein
VFGAVFWQGFRSGVGVGGGIVEARARVKVGYWALALSLGTLAFGEYIVDSRDSLLEFQREREVA